MRIGGKHNEQEGNAMAQVLTVDGITIKQPTNFRIERYNITKAGRVANGDMTLELIAKKLKFIFEYDSIDGDELDVILGVIDTTTMFFTLTYKENDVEKSATVYTGHLPTDQYRTDGIWLWRGFNFSLIEQ